MGFSNVFAIVPQERVIPLVDITVMSGLDGPESSLFKLQPFLIIWAM